MSKYIDQPPPWQPSCSIEMLQKRADLLNKIRKFFVAKNVLEVTTPVAAKYSVTDPHLHALTTEFANSTYYLQTSPEYYMKRLLAAGSGCIYQIAPAFRDDESGHLHQPEFSLLEWYRLGFDQHDLMDEVEELLRLILECKPARRISYADLFQEYLAIDPHSISKSELVELAKQNSLDLELLDKDSYLQLLMSQLIEPQIGQDAPCFVYDFPASQGALAKLNPNDANCAQRFEVYYKGIELANGFNELQDPNEQLARFQQDLVKRKALGYKQVEIDHEFIQALQHGLPQCSGIALGIDRLLMLMTAAKDISAVMSFVW